MLTKSFETVDVPGVTGRAEQVAHQVCSPHYVNPTGQRCFVVYVYGPYIDPRSGERQVLNYYTMCV